MRINPTLGDAASSREGGLIKLKLVILSAEISTNSSHLALIMRGVSLVCPSVRCDPPATKFSADGRDLGRTDEASELRIWSRTDGQGCCVISSEGHCTIILRRLTHRVKAQEEAGKLIVKQLKAVHPSAEVTADGRVVPKPCCLSVIAVIYLVSLNLG